MYQAFFCTIQHTNMMVCVIYFELSGAALIGIESGCIFSFYIRYDVTSMAVICHFFNNNLMGFLVLYVISNISMASL